MCIPRPLERDTKLRKAQFSLTHPLTRPGDPPLRGGSDAPSRKLWSRLGASTLGGLIRGWGAFCPDSYLYLCRCALCCMLTCCGMTHTLLQVICQFHNELHWVSNSLYKCAQVTKYVSVHARARAPSIYQSIPSSEVTWRVDRT